MRPSLFWAAALGIIAGAAAAQQDPGRCARDPDRAISDCAGIIRSKPTYDASDAQPRLEKIQISQREERERVKAAFQQGLLAAGPNGNAAWQVLGLRMWLVKGKNPRWLDLMVRVDSGDLVQILITSMIIARDIVSDGRHDHVHVAATRKWYGPDVQLMLGPSVNVTHSIGQRLSGREDWDMNVNYVVPSDRVLSVLRTWKTFGPPGSVDLPVGRIVISENYDPSIEKREQQIDARTADALNMTADEVRSIIRDSLHPQHKGGVNVATDAGCLRSDPGITCIDPRSLRRSANFPNPVTVIDDVCRDIKPTMLGNQSIICAFGQVIF